MGIASLESSLKQIYKDEEFNLQSVLAGALTEVGMGSLLKTDVFKEASDQAGKNADISTKRADDLAKRKKPNKKLVNNAQNEATSNTKTAKALDNLNNTGKIKKGAIAKTAANKAQDETKTKTKKKV